jgi:hypothetical protein
LDVVAGAALVAVAPVVLSLAGVPALKMAADRVVQSSAEVLEDLKVGVVPVAQSLAAVLVALKEAVDLECADQKVSSAAEGRSEESLVEEVLAIVDRAPSSLGPYFLSS